MQVYSQGTGQFIMNELLKLSSSPNITVRDIVPNFNQNKIKISYNEHVGRSKSINKLVQSNDGQTLFASTKNSITLNVVYNNHGQSANNTWLRIYPYSTNPEFNNCSIRCCEKHRKFRCTRLKETSSLIAESMVEVLNSDTKYELISLKSNENQISISTKYENPHINVTFEFKCYNSCIPCFKNSYPKLVFAIEEIDDLRCKINVLAQTDIQLKVCASPCRDSRPKRTSLMLNDSPQPIRPASTPQLNIDQHNKRTVEMDGSRYFIKLIHEKHLPVYNELSKLTENCPAEKLQKLEEEIYDRCYPRYNYILKEEQFP